MIHPENAEFPASTWQRWLTVALASVLPIAGAAIVLWLLTGCAAGPFQLGRLFPDGSSVHIVRANLTVSMTGAGSLSADEITWVGTNGFPIASGTNVLGSRK